MREGHKAGRDYILGIHCDSLYHGAQLVVVTKTIAGVAVGLLLFRVGAVTAQPTTPYDVLQAVYRFQFDDYERKWKQLEGDDKKSKTLLQLFCWRWKGVPVAYHPLGKPYHELLLEYLASLESDKQGGATVAYYKICTLLFLAEYHSSLGQTWQAVKYSQKAYPVITEAFDQGYTAPEFTFIRGLYNYYIEYYRHKNFFFRAAFLPFRDGDKEEGLRLLRLSATQTSMAQTEAKIFLTHVYLHLENNPAEALTYSSALLRDFPLNDKLRELHAECLLQNKRYEEAAAVISPLESHERFYFSCPGNFFRGWLEEEFYRNKTAARAAYQKCLLEVFKPIEGYQKRASARLRKMH